MAPTQVRVCYCRDCACGTKHLTPGTNLFLGYAPGMYLMYTFTNSYLQPANAAGKAIFQLSLANIAYNNRTCNYAGSDTVATCPPTNCQLATCNPRNIQAEYGADYCTGQPVTGPTPSNTIGCGIQVLATGYPIMGPPPPDNGPLTSSGATQCLDGQSLNILGSYTGLVFLQSTVAIGGYSASTFPSVASLFTQYWQTALSITNSSLVSIVQNGIVNAPTGMFQGRRLLQSYVEVTYQVGVPYTSSTAARTAMTQFSGFAASSALVHAGLTLANSVELLSAPVISSLSGMPVYVYSTTTTSSSNKKAVQLGVGIGVGGGGALILGLIAAYFLVLKKKNIEVGQKSAVTLAPMGAASK